jgi:hypothetical protein
MSETINETGGGAPSNAAEAVKSMGIHRRSGWSVFMLLSGVAGVLGGGFICLKALTEGTPEAAVSVSVPMRN